MTERTVTLEEPRLKPESPEWHAHLTKFWRAEIKRREVRLEEAKEELAAAKRAHAEHCEAAGFRQCDVCSEMRLCRELFAYGLETVVCEDCERADR